MADEIKIKFYGVICNAKIGESDFELIGKNNLTQKLLDLYRGLVFNLKDFKNWFLSLFGIESNLNWKIEVLDKY